MNTTRGQAAVTGAEGWALALGSVASFMVVLDLLVVATALSTIRRDLGASIGQLEWTVNAYTLAFAVLLMTAAAVGDRVRARHRRRGRPGPGRNHRRTHPAGPGTRRAGRTATPVHEARTAEPVASVVNHSFDQPPIPTGRTGDKTMTDHKVVGREEWQAARAELLRREKEHTRLGDELARQRRELPWVAVGKDYQFDADDGTRTLAELFDGRSQLMFYHFMFGPGYQAGCPVNSSMADGLDGLLPHLHARDVTLLLVSQAPLAKLLAYRRRMGWRIPWVSAANTDFNYDQGASYPAEQVRGWGLSADSLPPIVAVNAAATGTDINGYLSQSPAVSVFTRHGGAVYQTYATAARGVEFLMNYYPILDRVPKGRDEGDAFQTWIRRHDEYA
jgi:predicted dithiol-disulfide oxidoreductase (DUF899 family)